MIRCILYPGAKLYSAAGGKTQSAGILSEKIEEICTMIPAFDREIDRSRGKTVIRNDYCRYVFKNGSYIDNMTAGEKSRGKRRQGGIFEECVSIDKDILQKVLIPIANISRRCMDGTKHSEEPLNQSELYIKILVSLLSNWQQQIQEIAGNPLELEKLQHKYEIWLNANV